MTSVKAKVKLKLIQMIFVYKSKVKVQLIKLHLTFALTFRCTASSSVLWSKFLLFLCVLL